MVSMENEEKVMLTNENSISLKVHDLLNSLGLSLCHSGTRYLADAVKYAIQTGKSDIQSIKLYQQLIPQTNACQNKIEHCTRIAIQFANRDSHLQTQLSEKPTSKALIIIPQPCQNTKPQLSGAFERLFSLMVFLPRPDAFGSIELLQQNYAHQSMRECQVRKRHPFIRAGEHCVRKPV